MHDPVMNLLLCLLLLSSSCLARLISPSPAWGPSYPPELWTTKHLGPSQAPAFSPRYHGSVASSPVTKHHRRKPRAASPTSFPPPQGKDDCDGVSCSEPLTRTAFGSPCGCVIPMQVVIDFGIAPYLLFTQVQELAIEVAAGTFLKQSQVQIIGADASIYDQEKTTVTIYLVPLGNTFDSTTALLIYERIWQKKVPIDGGIFGDYEVINVHYPGLPSSPPSEPGQSSDFGPSGTGSQQYPFSANVPPGISQKLNSGIIAVIVLSSSILLLVCLGVVFIILKWTKLGRTASVVGPAITPSTTKRSGMKSLISSSMLSSASVSFVSTLPTCSPSIKTFSLAELEKATENFSSNKILGEGGFGCVYHAIMEDGSEAAVKLLTTMDQNKDREFIAEVEMLSRLHHRNLVKLIGICIEGSKRCLVYELVRNGSVESHLHGVDKKKGPLDWDARMKIALGAARGLAYLHEDSNPRVIHRDFKASNILLGDDFTPKVSDFGLAREASDVSHHISTRVMGTFGYVAPEYAMTGHLLVKSDVYSYGVVLLELLSGRKPVYMSQPRGPENLVTWARPLLASKEGVERLMDPSLSAPSCDFEDVAKVAAIASMCVSSEAAQRPFMGEVVQALKLIYNDTADDDDSNSHRDSSDFDYRESGNWWSRSTPRFVYGNASPFVTMEYSSDAAAEEIERPHSASDLAAGNRSGPLRRKRKKVSFYRLRRGSMSEHGHLSRRCTMY